MQVRSVRQGKGLSFIQVNILRVFEIFGQRLFFSPIDWFCFHYARDRRHTQVSVRALHVKLLLLPVDTHRNQCPRRFFHPINREMPHKRSVATKLRQRETTAVHLLCSKSTVSRVGNEVSCHRTGYDRRDIQVLDENN